MPDLRIEILGPLRVASADGTERRPPRGKAAALLAYLVVEADGADREILAALLWPDADPAGRRHSLRQALSSLRKLCGADPFRSGDRVALDPAVCATDVGDLADALASGDHPRAIALFRGPPLTDVEAAFSHDFDAWLDRRRAEFLHRLGEILEAEGLRVSEGGEPAALEGVVAAGVRAGLDAQVLRASLRGANGALPPWAAASVGSDALESMVYRLRVAVPPTAVLALEDGPGWCAETVAGAVASLPPEGRPAVVIAGPEGGPPEAVLAGVLRGLVRAPGGAAVRRETTATLDGLAGPGASGIAEAQGARVEAALVDALDAVLEEGPVVLVLPARGLRLTAATTLARALSLQGGEGLAVVVHARTAHELDALPVQALTKGCRDVRRVRQLPPSVGDAARPPQPPFGGARPEESPPRPPRRRGWLSARAVLAAGAVALLGILAWRRDPAPPSVAELMTEHDVILCSLRSGVAQHYRWSPATGIVERFAADTAVWGVAPDGERTCSAPFALEHRGDSVLLRVRAEGGYEWRAYANVQSRRDQAGRPVAVSPGERVVEGFGTYGVESPIADERGWLAVGRAAPSASGLPPGALLLDPVQGGHDPPWWLFFAEGEGSFDLFRFHAGTGAVERLTEGPTDETQGMLRGDSLIFVRGRLADEEDGSLELVLLRISTGEEELLTENGWNDYEVRWSPTGRHLCWQSEQLGHYQSEIWVMDLETRRSWNLSQAPGRDSRCRFSPDGRVVFYESFRTETRDVFARAVQGGPELNVSAFPGYDAVVGFVRRSAEAR